VRGEVLKLATEMAEAYIKELSAVKRLIAFLLDNINLHVFERSLIVGHKLPQVLPPFSEWYYKSEAAHIPDD
jgi:hypothetical protein